MLSPANCTNTSLFIGDLTKFCTEEDLEKLFTPYGQILDIKIKRNNNTGKTLSYGFVTFQHEECANLAMKQLDGSMFCGRKLRIRWAMYNARSQNPVNESVINSVYLNAFITEEDFHKVFDKFGSVTDVSIKESSIDKRTSRQSGYGFVHFTGDHHGVESAFRAVQELDNKTVEGVTYNVELSKNLLKQFQDYTRQQQQQQQMPTPPAQHSPQPPHVVYSPQQQMYSLDHGYGANPAYMQPPPQQQFMQYGQGVQPQPMNYRYSPTAQQQQQQYGLTSTAAYTHQSPVAGSSPQDRNAMYMRDTMTAIDNPTVFAARQSPTAVGPYSKHTQAQQMQAPFAIPRIETNQQLQQNQSGDNSTPTTMGGIASSDSRGGTTPAMSIRNGLPPTPMNFSNAPFSASTGSGKMLSSRASSMQSMSGTDSSAASTPQYRSSGDGSADTAFNFDREMLQKQQQQQQMQMQMQYGGYRFQNNTASFLSSNSGSFHLQNPPVHRQTQSAGSHYYQHGLSSDKLAQHAEVYGQQPPRQLVAKASFMSDTSDADPVVLNSHNSSFIITPPRLNTSAVIMEGFNEDGDTDVDSSPRANTSNPHSKSSNSLIYGSSYMGPYGAPSGPNPSVPALRTSLDLSGDYLNSGRTDLPTTRTSGDLSSAAHHLLDPAVNDAQVAFDNMTLMATAPRPHARTSSGNSDYLLGGDGSQNNAAEGYAYFRQRVSSAGYGDDNASSYVDDKAAFLKEPGSSNGAYGAVRSSPPKLIPANKVLGDDVLDISALSAAASANNISGNSSGGAYSYM